MVFWLNQQCNHFPKAVTNALHMCGTSDAGVKLLHILGVCVSAKTALRQRRKLSAAQEQYAATAVSAQLEGACAECHIR